MGRKCLSFGALCIVVYTYAALATSCPLSYNPVVDSKTGIPFYNDCLARRQLGQDAVLLSHHEALQAAAAADRARRLSETTAAIDDAASGPAAHDYLRLVPAPASATTDDVVVSSATISRFAQEGFFYVGRPGFLDGEPSARDSTTGQSEAAATGGDGSRVSLRVTLPEGDMYMKIWSGRDLQAMIDTQTSAAVTTLGLNRPAAPEPDTATATASRDDDAARPGIGGSYVVGGRRSLVASGSGRALLGGAAKLNGGSKADPTYDLSDKDKEKDKGKDVSVTNNGIGKGQSSKDNNGNGSGSKNCTGNGKGKGKGGGKGNNKGCDGGSTNSTSGGNTGGSGGSGDVPPVPRTEILTLSYPYTAVANIRIVKADSQETSWCSGALVGPTGRLVATAAHCLYNYDAVARVGRGYYAAFFVSPGQYRRNGTATLLAPYAKVPAGMFEVMAQYTSSGAFEFDIGLLRLSYHLTAPGSLGFDYICPTARAYPLASAGYPADATVAGSLWAQTFNISSSLCSTTANQQKPGILERNLGYTFAPGQNGSALWTPSDYVMRFVMSGSTPPAASVVTKTAYSWMLDFTTRAILNPPAENVVGMSANPRTYVKCSATTKACVGTETKAQASLFYVYPIKVNTRVALQLKGSTLCLTLVPATGAVNLDTCNTDSRFIFSSAALWNMDQSAELNNLLAAKSEANGALLKYNGIGQPLTAVPPASCAAKPSDCNWNTFKPLTV